MAITHAVRPGDKRDFYFRVAKALGLPEGMRIRELTVHIPHREPYVLIRLELYAPDDEILRVLETELPALKFRRIVMEVETLADQGDETGCVP